MLSSLRLVLRVDVLPGDEYNVAHATDGLWTLLDHLAELPTCRFYKLAELWEKLPGTVRKRSHVITRS
jgi:hypothetical protein